ncbi:hypothetical protein AU490_03895 [Lonsdalea populi]|uniref:Uncharacterized protein n=2 Tax=Lonsdalea TaxID=1082702 RepID=A0ACD1JD23_9GAMM|nr:hypothetical protein AU508_12335 [Lonsdalea populi]RAT13945.1 hypothetical protein AU485_07385 [Lonsdalea quercina]OSN01963.1 hypothetical protein AU499_03455 [Lonsdalea populi]RAT15521.1 hypothetical protein AU486_10015 [Lonsdalea quercina]RAT21928.1 hypothetical protein AU489_13800 [Lonsdalea populi]
MEGIPRTRFTDKFVAILMPLCASGTGIFGAMREGTTGNPPLRYLKTTMDLFTSAIFATLLGYAVITIAIGCRDCFWSCRSPPVSAYIA